MFSSVSFANVVSLKVETTQVIDPKLGTTTAYYTVDNVKITLTEKEKKKRLIGIYLSQIGRNINTSWSTCRGVNGHLI